jgi:hypothetical protein
MIVIFIGGAQGKADQQQSNFKTTSSVRAAHTKIRIEIRVGNCPHSTFDF